MLAWKASKPLTLIDPEPACTLGMFSPATPTNCLEVMSNKYAAPNPPGAPATNVLEAPLPVATPAITIGDAAWLGAAPNTNAARRPKASYLFFVHSLTNLTISLLKRKPLSTDN